MKPNKLCYLVRYQKTGNALAAFAFDDAARSYMTTLPADCRDLCEVVEHQVQLPIQWVNNSTGDE